MYKWLKEHASLIGTGATVIGVIVATLAYLVPSPTFLVEEQPQQTKSKDDVGNKFSEYPEENVADKNDADPVLPKSGEKQQRLLEKQGEIALGQTAAPMLSKPPYSPPRLTKSQLRGAVLESISVIYGTPSRSIRDEMNFLDSFPADTDPTSIIGDFRPVELVIRVEAWGDCSIPDDIAEVRTVGEFIAAVMPYCAGEK